MLAKSFSPLFQKALKCLAHSEQTPQPIEMERQGETERKRKGWEVETESNKACWSPKLQKLIGHSRVGLHLHPAIALGRSCRKLDTFVFHKF